VGSLHRDWITNLIMDPDSKVPGITTLGNGKVTDLLPDVYSMTVLFFEPDPTFTKVQRAWLIGNMYPTGAGDDTGRRDKTQDGEQLILSITYTGIQQVGYAVNHFAQKILDSMNKTGTNPNQAPAFIDTISPDVAVSQFGYKEKLDEASRSFIRP
jgi:phospholipase C